MARFALVGRQRGEKPDVPFRDVNARCAPRRSTRPRKPDDSVKRAR